MAVPVLWLLAEVSAAAAPFTAQSEVMALASASPRPAECRGAPRAAVNAEVWDRAREPRLRRYCDALGRGYARLGRSPADALAAASLAERILPGRAATLVLRARASLALKSPDTAWQAFSKATSVSRRSLEAPAALHDFGRAALATGHYAEALAAYRQLAPRTGLFDDLATKQRVYVETAALVMHTGPDNLNEAIGYLVEARRLETVSPLDDFVRAALALALDRQGRSEEAAGVLAEASGPLRLERFANKAHLPELPPGELSAMIALSSMRADPASAAAAWREFLQAQPNSAFRQHARDKLAQLTAPRSRAGH